MEIYTASIVIVDSRQEFLNLIRSEIGFIYDIYLLKLKKGQFQILNSRINIVK